MRSGWVALTAVVFLACTSDPIETACGGARPALEDCVVGSNWAQCGGQSGGAPRLGCRGQCYWFEGGCVAAEFEVSPCPAEDLCCVTSGSGGWPFDPPAGGPGFDEAGPTLFFVGWGTEPWSRERARDVDVELGALTSIDDEAMTCTSDNESLLSRGPCRCPTQGQRWWDDDVLVVEARASCVAILFWSLSIEVTRDNDETLHARVCRLESTDAAIAQCPVDREPVCADAGTVTLDVFPESLEAAQSTRVEVSVRFPDGMEIEGSL